jgi:hypothetical protein
MVSPAANKFLRDQVGVSEAISLISGVTFVSFSFSVRVY